LTISGGGAVSNTFGFIGFLGGQGTVTVDGEGSSWTSTENVFVSANAALNIQNGGSVQSEKTMIVDGGTVTLEDGQLTGQAITLNSGAFNFTGGGLSVESFQGSLTQRGGTLAPGSSTGITTVTGNYDMLAGTFEVELAGAGGVAGSDFDQLIVRETAKLQGDLLVKLIDGFIPSVDDTFLILDPTILIGQFMGLAEGATFLADGVVFDITYLGGDGNDVVLRVSGFGLPGDYNDDGTVDAADYVVWRKNEGTTIPLPNDPIGGIIGPAQFNQWRANFGASAGNGSANRPVPEPTTLVLALIAFGAIRSIGGRARR
jgi:T5SS/PEP-CTERM-associated repeat protein